MTDYATFELDLEDGKKPLKLAYPLGALRRIYETIEVHRSLFELSGMLQDVRADTVGVFVWGGCLWQDRELKLHRILERVDWSPRKVSEVSKVVSEALLASLVGPAESAESDAVTAAEE